MNSKTSDNVTSIEYHGNDSVSHAGTNEEYAVGDADIQNKSGNYIFTVGNVGCGKSTMQNLLIYRLWSREDINFEYKNKDGNHIHDKLLNDMVVNIQKGYLPDRTRQGILQEFNVSLSQTNKKKLGLNFLEISGEDIRSIVPTLDGRERPQINKQLIDYLKLRKGQINKRFIFVSDAEENKKNRTTIGEMSEDVLFNELLRYLLGKNGLGMRKLSLLFVAAKWDTVNKEYKNVEHYFRKNFPQTRSVLKSGRCNVQYIPFSVGTIDVIDENGDGHFVTKITSLESKYVDVLVQWIYHTFTGNSLKGFPKIHKTLLDRVMSLFG